MAQSSESRDSCLHLVVDVGPDALTECLRHLGPDDAVLFLDAGVLHLLGVAHGALGGLPAAVYYAAADLAAQGLAETARQSGCDIVDDARICDLLLAHRHSLTWA